MLRFPCALAAWLGLSVAACGGGDTVESLCAAITPCGGDLTGTWSVVSSCQSVSGGVSASCPTATENLSAVHFSGTKTFNADLTYASALTISGNLVLNVPRTCLQGTPTCADLDEATQRRLDHGTFQSVACEDGSGANGCECTFALVPSTTTESGMYATSGGMLTQTPEGASADLADYCVQGGRLSMSPKSGTMVAAGAMGMSTVAIVFAK